MRKNTGRSQQQQGVSKQKKVEADHFFNLLTSPQLLEPMETLLPEYRERLYDPPTVCLSMFLGQALGADGSRQMAVNEAIINRWCWTCIHGWWWAGRCLSG